MVEHSFPASAPDSRHSVQAAQKLQSESSGSMQSKSALIHQIQQLVLPGTPAPEDSETVALLKSLSLSSG
jgi:hypothetical protein